MRLWSIHPKYLDSKGLVALWREALLAQKVLMGATRGYVHHPQLIRFKEATDPLRAIGVYLDGIWVESKQRDYNFDRSKINRGPTGKSSISLKVARGQVAYERKHLLSKLKDRDVNLFKSLKEFKIWSVHPMFKIVEGDVEHWEIEKK